MRPSNPIEEMKVYASQSSYVQPPTDAQTAAGVVPLDTLPADWWNRLLHDITENLNNCGLATQSVYDEILNVLQAAGITPSTTSSSQLLASIQKLARNIATASTAGSVVSSSVSGKVSVDQDGVMTPNGLGTPSSLNTLSRNVVDAINEILTTLTNYIQSTNATLTDLQSNKAPTNHASNQTTYGVGSAANYGHVKLSDALDSVLGAADGVAATPKAIKAVYDAIRGLQTNFFDTIYPLGFVYTQEPMQKGPNELWGELSTWAELINYNGKFMRTANAPTTLYSIDGQSFYKDINRTWPVITTGLGSLSDTGQTVYDQDGNTVHIYSGGWGVGGADAFIEEGGTLSAQSGQNKSHNHGGSTGSGGVDHYHDMLHRHYNGGDTGSADVSHNHTYQIYGSGHNTSSGNITDESARNRAAADTTTSWASLNHTHSWGNWDSTPRYWGNEGAERYNTGGASAVSHTHGIDSDGGSEARPDNFTQRKWVRIA